MKLGKIAICLKLYQLRRHHTPERRIMEHMRQKPDTQFPAMC